MSIIDLIGTFHIEVNRSGQVHFNSKVAEHLRTILPSEVVYCHLEIFRADCSLVCSWISHVTKLHLLKLLCCLKENFKNVLCDH